ncbi:viroplasmin family protein [Fusibacter sp. 3D3]|uniref:ribonuclease H1 domain-containing protein n=1 Tax=Fusibacter sp. 3D3 TaxID=1048380 RepID=UPI000852A29D|nr:ribonuclease H family protein [Fusibacter sp. 3D3]GAU78295.1 ribonuclease HI-related protein [Fusibacter sp. 3D3]
MKNGRKTGIFNTWAECKRQIDGFSGAIYKSFSNYEEAENYIDMSKHQFNKDTNWEVESYVDGSYSENLKMYSYGCLIFINGETIELSEAQNATALIEMRNVAGEILGAQKAIEWAYKNGHKSIKIFYDYEGIEKWANGEWAATKIGTKEYQHFIHNFRQKLDIGFEKVKAHSGNIFNEQADNLAKQALLIFENSKHNDPIEEMITLSEKYKILFLKITNETTTANNSFNFIFNDLSINEKIAINFIKKVWVDLGNKVKDICTYDIQLHCNEDSLIWTICSNDGSSYKYKINNITRGHL